MSVNNGVYANVYYAVHEQWYPWLTDTDTITIIGLRQAHLNDLLDSKMSIYYKCDLLTLNVSEACGLEKVASLGVGRWGLELWTYPGCWGWCWYSYWCCCSWPKVGQLKICTRVVTLSFRMSVLHYTEPWGFCVWCFVIAMYCKCLFWQGVPIVLGGSHGWRPTGMGLMFEM